MTDLTPGKIVEYHSPTSYRNDPMDVLRFWLDSQLDYKFYYDKFVRTGDETSLNKMLDRVTLKEEYAHV